MEFVAIRENMKLQTLQKISSSAEELATLKHQHKAISTERQFLRNNQNLYNKLLEAYYPC